MLGLCLLAQGSTRAAGTGEDLSPGLAKDGAGALTEAPAIATGNQAIDLLLRRDVVSKEPAVASSAAARSVAVQSAASAAAMGGPVGGMQGNQPTSLREALLREGAEFAAAHTRGTSSGDAAAMRAEANLDGGPLPPGAGAPAGQVAASDADGWLVNLRDALLWVRENRFMVGGWALGFGLLVGLTTVWRAYRRMDRAREQARRRRRDSRPPASRTDAHGTGRSATRSALR